MRCRQLGRLCSEFKAALQSCRNVFCGYGSIALYIPDAHLMQFPLSDDRLVPVIVQVLGAAK